jgi:hypothetical protein
VVPLELNQVLMEQILEVAVVVPVVLARLRVS